jgi:hypothetical protein
MKRPRREVHAAEKLVIPGRRNAPEVDKPGMKAFVLLTSFRHPEVAAHSAASKDERPPSMAVALRGSLRSLLRVTEIGLNDNQE